MQTAAEHGFTAIADVDIMDAEGDIELPVRNGRHLNRNYVGKNWENYDFTIVLSHFKGHPMAGFGGALKMWPSAWHRRVEKRGYILPALHWMCLSTGENVPPQNDFPRIHG